MFDFTSADVQSGFVALTTIFFVLHLTRNRLFVDASFIVLHLAFLAREVNVGVFSAWHVK